MFYILDYSADTKIIGPEYPQVQKMKMGYDFKAPNSVYKLARCYKDLPDFTPDLNGFILHSKAKQTDFLSNVFTSPNGFLISEKVKNILQTYNLPLHAFYPINIYHKKESYNTYFWLHMIYDLTDLIDYPNSVFFIYQNYAHDLGNIDITSKEDFFTKRTQLEEQNKGKNITIWSKEIKFLVPIKYDFFKIGRLNSNIYVSEGLKNIFKEEQVNGIALSQALIE